MMAPKPSAQDLTRPCPVCDAEPGQRCQNLPKGVTHRERRTDVPRHRSLEVACPACAVAPGAPCRFLMSGHFHPERRSALRRTLKAEAARAAKAARSCHCTNHMGGPKVAHRTKAAALAEALRKSRRFGMRMEPYPCPTMPGRWHLRTARTRERTAADA